MGSAASLNEYHVDAQIQQLYRHEIASLFAEEFQRLRGIKATSEQLENEFIDVLQEKEPAILRKIGLTDDPRKKKGPERAGSISSPYVDDQAEFRQLCVDSVDKIRSKNAMILMCAVDGSEGADVAFRTMMRLRKRLDTVCLFHAYSDEAKSDDRDRFSPDSIREHYEAELISTYRVPVSRSAIYWEDRRGQSVGDIFLGMLSEWRLSGKINRSTHEQPNLFFCGYVGRKGRKVDSTLVGSFTLLAMQYTHMPLVICKSLCPPSGRLFVIAVDGSPLSKRGFDLAITIINPRDAIRIVNVCNPRKTAGSGCEPPPEEIQEFFQSELDVIGPVDSNFATIVCPQGSNIAKCLVEFSNTIDADFIVLSPRTRCYMSSTVEYIVSNVNASVILCKN
jgi:nucleotide-binding universal stress UspA family protein